MDQVLSRMRRRLERMELDHLRDHAAGLAEQLEAAKAEAERAWQMADYWREHAMDLQEALHDENFATHRCVGITKSGELMVVRKDTDA